MWLPFSSYNPNTVIQPHWTVAFSYLSLLSAIFFFAFLSWKFYSFFKDQHNGTISLGNSNCFSHSFLKKLIKFIQVTLVNEIIQVSDSHFITHALYIALCAHHPKLNNLRSPHIWLLCPSLSLTPLSSGNHHAVACAYEFLFVYFSCLFICYFQFYVPHMNEIMQVLAFSD